MSRLIALALAIMLPALSLAEDRDTQEISRYVLTDAALAKYASAMQKLRPLAGQISACDDDSEGAKSISQMAASIDRVPAAKTAITSSGLTTREYVVFGFAMFQTGLAAWSLEQGGGLPPGVSKANVDFYKSHRTAIEGIKPIEDDCDSAAEEEEPEE